MLFIFFFCDLYTFSVLCITYSMPLFCTPFKLYFSLHLGAPRDIFFFCSLYSFCTLFRIPHPVPLLRTLSTFYSSLNHALYFLSIFCTLFYILPLVPLCTICLCCALLLLSMLLCTLSMHSVFFSGSLYFLVALCSHSIFLCSTICVLSHTTIECSNVCTLFLFLSSR